MKVFWTDDALESVEEIADYILEKNPQAAEDIQNKIHKKVELLSYNPMSGKQSSVEGVRELILGSYPYSIFYRIKKDWIEIIKVLHQSRNSKYRKNEHIFNIQR